MSDSPGKTEINFRVAELLGIKAAIINDEAHSLYRDESRCDLLDYVDDPVQREPLIIELLDNNWKLNKEAAEYDWLKANFGCVSHKHFGTATCLAFIEMMESKDG